MAFSFGNFGASSAPAFGASSAATFGSSFAPAFGASSAPAFGAQPSSAPAFGATSAPSFSFGSAPAFGAPASSTSAFGASSTPSLFGTSSTPSLFGGASAPSMFGAASAPATGAFAFGSAAGQTSSLFSSSTQPAAGALTLALPTQQPQQQQLITYSTKYDSLPPQVQKELQDIQREISNYREDCEKLDRDPRLHDSAALKRSMEEETSSLKAALMGMLNAIKADDEQLTDFREKVMQLLRSTESAVRTFQRAKLWRDAPQQYKGQVVPPQIQDVLQSPVVLPAPYLEAAILGFAGTLDSYRQVVSELESSLPPSAFSGTDESSLAMQLPTIVAHMHDYFVHVAARMEQLHNEVERSKAAFLEQRRALSGDMSDPFLASRRYEQHASSSGAKHLVTVQPATYAAQPMHAGTPHGPGASPTPGAFGTPLPGMAPQGFAPASPFGGPVNPAAGDASRKSSGKGRRK